MKLDKEEKDILEALENDEIIALTPSKKEIAEVKAMVENTLRKDRRVTIRLYDHDLKGIQKKALEKGLPYQTLISSIIHQYIEGDLIERKIG